MTRIRISAALAILHLAIAGITPAMAAPYLQGPTSRGIEAAAMRSVLHVQQSQQEFFKEVQESLQALGLYRGAIDGIWGPGSQRGLDEFMRRAGYRGEYDDTAHGHLWWAAYIRKARDISVDVAIREAPSLAKANEDLVSGNQARSEGRYGDAEAMYRRALEARERTLGPEHPDTLQSLMGLANILFDTGRYADAEGLRRYVFEAQERRLGPDHPDTLASLNNLAGNLLNQGHNSEAEALYERLLDTQERNLGLQHPNTLGSLSNLALIHSNQGRYLDAEVLNRRVLEARERVLGPDHPDTLASLNNLAGNLHAQGRYADAEALYRRALEAIDRILGPNHPSALGIRTGLASTLSRQRQFAGAEALRRENLEATQRVLGHEHPNTLAALIGLATTLFNQGNYNAAEQLYRHGFEAFERSLGSGHPDTLGSLKGLANSLLLQDRYAEAEALFGRALEASERMLGPEHPETLAVRNNLALSLLVPELDQDPPALRNGFSTRPGLLWSIDQFEPEFADRVETYPSRALLIWEAGFPALPGYLTITGRLEGGGDAGSRSPLDLELYLATLAELEINPQEKAVRSFPVQGFLTYSTLDIALGDQAARGAIADEAAGRALRDLQDAREALDQSRRAYLASFEDEGRAAARDGLTQAMREAESRLADVTARIERDFPALAELELPQPLTADEAQALLRPDEGMVAFAATDETLYAWFATQETITWKPIPVSRADLAEAVAGLRAAVDMEQKPADYQVDDACALRARHAALADRPFDLCASQALHDMLFEGFDLSGIDNLIVVADGPLQQLPFAMLVSDRHDDGTPRWLIEDRAVTALPTTSSLRALRRDASVSASDDRRPFLGFAPVTFDGPGDGSPLRSTLIDLPATEDEVRFLAGVLGAGPDGAVLGDAATEAQVKSTRLDRYRVVSFATHGLLSREAEEVTDGAVRDPALVLRAGGGEDGLLTASEVATLRLDADWVLLSGCNTAGGGGEDARGLSGLARAFFFAGARSLLVSHWSVDDNAAMELMIETVSRDVDNEAYGRAQALRQAQLTVMSNPDHAHPLFWAPFDLVGESR